MNKHNRSILIGKKIKVPNISIYELFKNRSKINADKIICRCHEDEMTFSMLKNESEIIAKAFLEIGVKKGDIIPLCIEPSCIAVIIFFALNRIGAISTFLNTTASQKEIEKYIKLYNSNIFVYSNMVDLDIKTLFDKCGIKKTILIHKEQAFKKYSQLSKLTLDYIAKTHNKCEVSMDFDEFYQYGKESVITNTLDKNDCKTPAFIAYTSGTTGEPKSILLSNENIIAEMLSLRKTTFMQYGPKGNALQVVPFYYPYGFLISVLFPIFVGKTVALTPILTVETTAEYLKMYKPKYLSAIPPFYKSFFSDSQINKMDLSFIKYPISGGDIISKDEIEKINAFLNEHGSKGKLLNGSGNGEGCGSLTNPLTLFDRYNIDSIGKPIYGLSVKFVDKDGNVVEKNQTGRFCFSGKNVMVEYYNDQSATRKVKYTDSDGIEWFHTDTYGHMDKDNWIYFDGRERRFFITYDSSGSPYKVYCEHVQNIIKKHCEVTDCIVVKRSDKIRYHVSIAFVVIKGKKWEEIKDEIKELCDKELPSCAIPFKYINIEKLPISNSGKIDYRALEKLAEESDE